MRLALTALILLFTVSLTAQIGEAREDIEIVHLGGPILLYHSTGKVNGKAGITIFDTKDAEGRSYHILYYQNQEYQQLADVQKAGFFASKADIDYLFEEMRKVFKTKKTVSIPIGKSEMTVNYFNVLGRQLFIQMSGDVRGHFSLTPGGLYYLLGKGDQWDRKAFKKHLKS